MSAPDPADGQPAPAWHWAPHPTAGHQTRHKGPRETCTGPDCGPEHPALVLRRAAALLRRLTWASMRPGVDLALADLLDDLADGDDHGAINPWALAIARTILAALDIEEEQQ